MWKRGFSTISAQKLQASRARAVRAPLPVQKSKFLYNSLAPYLCATMLKTACAVYNKTTTTARQKARNARKARFLSFFQEKKWAICEKNVSGKTDKTRKCKASAKGQHPAKKTTRATRKTGARRRKTQALLASINPARSAREKPFLQKAFRRVRVHLILLETIQTICARRRAWRIVSRGKKNDTRSRKWTTKNYIKFYKVWIVYKLSIDKKGKKCYNGK